MNFKLKKFYVKKKFGEAEEGALQIQNVLLGLPKKANYSGEVLRLDDHQGNLNPVGFEQDELVGRGVAGLLALAGHLEQPGGVVIKISDGGCLLEQLPFVVNQGGHDALPAQLRLDPL